MEARKPEMVQFAPVISELTEKGCKDDVLKLVKEDLELGYPKELVVLYAEAGWQVERCRKFSSIMRANSDRGLLRLLADGGFNPYQMQLLANYYEKGVTVAQLIDVGSKNLTAYDMEQALKLVYRANLEAEEEKRSEIKTSQENIESMTEMLRQKEKELEEQQETNNRRASENAELRIKLENLENRIKELEQEKAGYESEKRSILEERDCFYQQNQTLLQEKEQLIADIEAVQKEKDEMEQRLKENDNKRGTQIAAPQNVTRGRQTVGTGQMILRKQEAESENNSNKDSSGGDFLVAIRGRNGEKYLIPAERMVRKKSEGLKAFAEKFFSKENQSSGLIKQLTGKGLNPAQMEQIRMAIQAGFSEQEVKDLINGDFSAEEMAQAIEIVVAEKAYQ